MKKGKLLDIYSNTKYNDVKYFKKCSLGVTKLFIINKYYER